MNQIIFKHHRNTTNIGDRSCSPYDAFWKDDSGATAMDFSEPTPSGVRAVIFGGGQIMRGIEKRLGENDRLSPLLVSWGVGTRHRVLSYLVYRRGFRSMDLVGSRDWGDRRFTFVPCASCMSPLFDAPAPPEHEVVMFLHRWKTDKDSIDIPTGYPVAYNDVATMQDAIRHIGSGATVVSNSYHGVYWALLLGRRVLCLPFSNKFMHYRNPPGYSTPDDWTKSLKRAKASTEMLGLCREANLGFARIVKSRLEP